MTAASFARLCEVAPLALILLAWYLSGPSPFDLGMRATLWTAGVIWVLYLPIKRQSQPRAYLDLPIGRTAFVNANQYEKLQWLAQHTHPGETFFDEPFIAFSLGLESPGPLDFVAPTEFTRPEQIDLLLRGLTVYQTRYIYLYPWLYVAGLPGDNLGPFRSYLSVNYHLAKEDAGGQIWERN
jgi:hypothetical protein